MIGSKLLPACILAALVAAQTPPGFAPLVPQNLQVTYGANNIAPAGKLIPRPEVAQPPTLAVPQNIISPTAKGLVVMIDLDVPRNNARVTNLHWLGPNVDISRAVAAVPATATGGAVTYRQPSPPAGDIPHRYVFLMYQQPANFAVPPQFANLAQNRLGFDIAAFSTAAGLGQPVAANFITVQT